MNDPLKKLEEQVAGKIYWGATSAEVLDWLVSQMKVPAEAAEEMIRAGFKARRREVRQRAMIRSAFAGFGLLLFIGFLCAQFFGGFVVIGIPVLVVWGLGLASIGVIIYSLRELLTGNSDRPM